MTYPPSGQPHGEQNPGGWPHQPGPPQGPAGYGQGYGQTVCTWHPDRATALSCSRCGRPACPECLSPASVGFHCRACVAESQATQRVARTVSGARAGVEPFVTYILIAINVIVFLIVSIQAGSADNPSRSALWIDGALIPGAVSDGDYYRMVTAGFLHGGLIHVGLNMLSLYFLGPTLERILGRTRFAVVYLISLLGSSVSVLLLSSPTVPTIGASGAIFGLLGALAVTFKRMNYDLRQLAVLIVINLVITFRVDGISWQAHLGGLVVGAIVGAAMVYPSRENRMKVQVAACAAVLVVLAGVTVYKADKIVPYTCQYVSSEKATFCGPPEVFR